MPILYQFASELRIVQVGREPDAFEGMVEIAPIDKQERALIGHKKENPRGAVADTIPGGG